MVAESKPAPTSKPPIALAITATRDAAGHWHWTVNAADRRGSGESAADSRVARGLNALALAAGL